MHSDLIVIMTKAFPEQELLRKTSRPGFIFRAVGQDVPFGRKLPRGMQ